MANIESIDSSSEMLDTNYPSFLDSIPGYMPFIGPIQYFVDRQDSNKMYGAYLQTFDQILASHSNPEISHSNPQIFWLEKHKKVQELSMQLKQFRDLLQKEEIAPQKLFDKSVIKAKEGLFGNVLTLALLVNLVTFGCLCSPGLRMALGVTGTISGVLYALSTKMAYQDLEALNQRKLHLLQLKPAIENELAKLHQSEQEIQKHLDFLSTLSPKEELPSPTPDLLKEPPVAIQPVEIGG
jgi:hypothetical protein